MTMRFTRCCCPPGSCTRARRRHTASSGTTPASGIRWRGSGDARLWSRRPSGWWTSASPCSPASPETTGSVTSYLCSPKTLYDPAALVGADFFIITVPTPVDGAKRPDLRALLSASHTVGRALRPGGLVVYESTVYPGVTENECVPVLEQASGLKYGSEFAVGYSPERINPGDPSRRLENIQKIVSATDDTALRVIAAVYRSIISAGVYCAPNIRTAEAA